MDNKRPLYLSERNGDLWLTEDERENLQIDYRIKDIIYEEQSAFQYVMILDSYAFGRMLTLDGIVQTTSSDGHIYNEMIAHIPLCIHPNPRRVLIIGGGDCGAAKEVCKYDQVERIDLVEIDKLVVEACQKHLPEVSGRLSDPRVHFFFEDGVDFVKNKAPEYDVIIVDSSDPIGPAEVLFEKSFYQSLSKALKDDGLMVCQSESPIFYAEIMRQTHQRISAIFAQTALYMAVVPTYPGGFWSFTIGSKQHITPDPTRLRGQDLLYVNEPLVKSCFDLPQFVLNLL